MRLITLSIVVFTMTLVACGQKTEVPVKVKKAFEQKISDAKNVEWEYDSEDKFWEAEYKIGKDEFTSAFNENGKWVETEQEIKFSELPDAVKSAIEADFSEFEIEEIEYVETPEGKFYELEVEKENDKTEIEYELLFSPDGKLIKKEEEKDEDED